MGVMLDTSELLLSASLGGNDSGIADCSFFRETLSHLRFLRNGSQAANVAGLV